MIDGEEPYFIHRSLQQIGELAVAIGAENLILAHNFKKALDRLDASLAAIASVYDGPVEVADDLSCFAL